MFVVVKLGGCNGSGKTSVARALLDIIHSSKPWSTLGKSKSNKHYRGAYAGYEVVVLGSYENVCGGMDTISDKEDRLALIKNACKPNRIIFFEGLITGKTYGQIGHISEQHVKSGKGRWLYTFMDTPFDVCSDRVMARRAEAGNTAPFDPERTMRPTYDSCWSLLRKIRQEQAAKIGPQPMEHPTLLLSHKRKPDALARLVLDTAVNHMEGVRS